MAYASLAPSVQLKKKDAPQTTTEDDAASLPALDMLDEIVYKGNAVGFLLLGIGVITGAVWANDTWGRYWSWGPKETWSLITSSRFSLCQCLHFMQSASGPMLMVFSS